MVLSQRWQLQRHLGRGAMGDVYLGHDMLLDRPVAIKRLADHLSNNQTFLERFRREAMASSRLAHPNVVTTFDFGIDDGRPYLVMELVDGKTLDEMIQLEGPMDLETTLELARQVAAGLAAAHRTGIVHRDIKPANIMLTKVDGQLHAKLMDFGVAALDGLDSHETPHLTMTGFVVGTPGFVAPEQLSGAAVTPAADLYALGVTMYEMLTGRLPWPDEDSLALLQAQVLQPPHPIGAYRPELPRALVQLIHDLLQTDVDQRPKSAEAVAKQLKRYISVQQAPVAVSLPSPTPPTVAVIGLDTDRENADRQLGWFIRAVQGEGGRLAQTVGREVVAWIPSPEAGIRLYRAPPEPPPRMSVRAGDVELSGTGLASGPGVRQAIGIARIACPGELLIDEQTKVELGLGWQGRFESKGHFGTEGGTGTGLYGLKPARTIRPPDIGCIEQHVDGPHWRCACGAHGPLPVDVRGDTLLRIRCAKCSSLLDLTLPALPHTSHGSHAAMRVSGLAKPPNVESADDRLLTELTILTRL